MLASDLSDCYASAKAVKFGGPNDFFRQTAAAARDPAPAANP
jgi:hypothetical protein